MDTSNAAQASSILESFLASSKPTPSTTSLIPSHVKIGGSADMSSWSKEYLSVINVIGCLSECSNILALPSARCPIVRFTVSSLNVSCDVSVNRRLGPYNSKLLKAYLNFDKRVSPLLYLLKSWLRICGVMGFKRTQINNYSLSLMLIYALQKTSPPVLPCFQDPRTWPLNMEWYGRAGFMLRKHEAEYIDGWKVDFVNPNSLLPSKNSSSIAELARHFFNFYSAVFSFSNHAVTVHTPLLLTIQDAVQLSLQDPTHQESMTESGGMKISPLCVQDPFDLLHNVTKAVTPSTLNALVEEMKQAVLVMDNLLSASPSLHNLGILSLFVCQTPTSPFSSPEKSYKTTYQLHFSLKMIEKLVSKVPAAVGLSLPFPTNITCTTYTNSWRGRRWKRRHDARLATGSTNTSPVLLFTLSSMDPSSYRGKKREEIVVSVALTVNDVSMSSEFSLFFAFFKKLCLS
ncbi:PREDICTED: speckle targeted PIP5K1A-regulated poly(A) polymerase-like [Amphimedon queenslandica]|uniref:PAP-associated domain-containing protein n=1 Tax=Amphimedon queenslandica TaxID=400682 RepID=A0AAN0J9G3_AMPQE|nr:PREDICTED: speckle targeted PIP5K1A-regulated poly(A) polymerase-like [Amphimedon queenslandica]|eukprot:XP_019853366.1 PREDICTED: speckle targeted PIP5K1A-regulated poly(A) polymerase-like [Amphimedon queenslandica]